MENSSSTGSFICVIYVCWFLSSSSLLLSRKVRNMRIPISIEHGINKIALIAADCLLLQQQPMLLCIRFRYVISLFRLHIESVHFWLRFQAMPEPKLCVLSRFYVCLYRNEFLFGFDIKTTNIARWIRDACRTYNDGTAIHLPPQMRIDLAQLAFSKYKRWEFI